MFHLLDGPTHDLKLPIAYPNRIRATDFFCIQPYLRSVLLVLDSRYIFDALTSETLLLVRSSLSDRDTWNSLPPKTMSQYRAMFGHTNSKVRLSQALSTLRPYRWYDIDHSWHWLLVSAPFPRSQLFNLLHCSSSNRLEPARRTAFDPHPFYSCRLQHSFYGSGLRNMLCCYHVVRYADSIGRPTLRCCIHFPTSAKSTIVHFIVTVINLLNSDGRIVFGGDDSNSVENTGTYNTGVRTFKTSGNAIGVSSTVVFIHNAHRPNIVEANGFETKSLSSAFTLLQCNSVQDVSSPPCVVKVGLYDSRDRQNVLSFYNLFKSRLFLLSSCLPVAKL